MESKRVLENLRIKLNSFQTQNLNYNLWESRVDGFHETMSVGERCKIHSHLYLKEEKMNTFQTYLEKSSIKFGVECRVDGFGERVDGENGPDSFISKQMKVANANKKPFLSKCKT